MFRARVTKVQKLKASSSVKDKMSDKKLNQKNGDVSLLKLMSELAQNTGMHGVPNIQRSSDWTRKILWLVVVLAGLCMLSWKVSEAILKYLRYPTDTNINFYNSPYLVFPAVTICNLNPIRMNAFGDWHGDGAGAEGSLRNLLMTESQSEDGAAPDWSNNGSQSFRDWDAEEQNANDDYFEEEDTEFEFMNDFLAYTAQMSDTELFKYGHKMKDMLLSCRFLGKKCSPKNFTVFQNYLYGNCFTFNLDGALQLNKDGPLYGLVLEMFIEQDEYIPYISKSAGLRVAIHNQTDMPFPEDQGFSVSPGARTSVGIKKTGVIRSSPPYGPCETYSDEQNKKLNGYVNTLPSIGYTSAACKKTCLQTYLLTDCGCFDYKYPFDDNITAYENITYSDDVFPCDDPDLGNQTVKCVKNIETRYNQNNLGCSAKCPVSCYTSKYDLSMSTAMHPSSLAKDLVLDTLVDHSEMVYDLLEESDDAYRETYVRDNVLKLEIYFESLNYEEIKTAPSYLSMSLLSDLGGQAGLWLGLSIIAFFEVVELLVDLGKVCYYKATHKPGKVSDSQHSLDTVGEDKDQHNNSNYSSFNLSMATPLPT